MDLSRKERALALFRKRSTLGIYTEEDRIYVDNYWRDTLDEISLLISDLNEKRTYLELHRAQVSVWEAVDHKIVLFEDVQQYLNIIRDYLTNKEKLNVK